MLNPLSMTSSKVLVRRRRGYTSTSEDEAVDESQLDEAGSQSEEEEPQSAAESLDSDADEEALMDTDADVSDQDQESNEGDEKEGKSAGAMSGWGDAISKILRTNKPKATKSVVLSRAKKLTDPVDQSKVKPDKKYDFQIDGEVKEEKPDPDSIEIKPIKEILAERKRKRDMILDLRIKPTIFERERENAFKKIATRGVVQLFNAVRFQQKDLSQKLKDVGSRESKRDQVLSNIDKKGFLDVLMSGPRAKSELVDNRVKDEEHESTWSVLRNDFMMGKKSNWDKEGDDDDDDDNDNGNGEENNSSLGSDSD